MYSALEYDKGSQLDNIQIRQRQANSRILGGITFPSTVALEVVDHGRSIVTQIAEIDRLTTLLEQEHTIENLEELRGRLMDTTHPIS